MKQALSVLLLLIATMAVKDADAREYVIYFSHVVAPDTPKGRAADLFAQLVNERLAGKVRVEVYANARLYDDENVLLAMLANYDDHFTIMAAPSLSQFRQYSRVLQVFDLPFLFRDVEEARRLMDSPLAAELTGSLIAKEIQPLTYWDNGMKVFSVRGAQPLKKVPDDFKGKLFRIQNSNVLAAMMESLGGSPWRAPFRGLYFDLAKGIVAGQENTWSNIYSQKLHEVQDWITVSNHSYLGYLVVVNKRFWENLPAELRGDLETALKEATQINLRLAAEKAVQDRQRVEQAGHAKVVELTPEEREQWRQATAGVEQRFAAEIGPELLAKIHKLLGH